MLNLKYTKRQCNSCGQTISTGKTCLDCLHDQMLAREDRRKGRLNTLKRHQGQEATR